MTGDVRDVCGMHTSIEDWLKAHKEQWAKREPPRVIPPNISLHPKGAKDERSRDAVLLWRLFQAQQVGPMLKDHRAVLHSPVICSINHQLSCLPALIPKLTHPSLI